MSGRDRSYPRAGRHGQVVHTLGARIVQGVLNPDVVLPTEDELIGELGVGRSALRDGVKVLAGKGLLESRTSAGTRVRARESWNLLDPDVLRWRYAGDPNLNDIAVLADLRVALEPGAARLAAESADRGRRLAVEVALTRLLDAADSADDYLDADLAFHRAIFVASNNDLLLYLHDVVNVAMRSVRDLHTHSIAHNKAALPFHEEVAGAIRRGHHRKAEEAMRAIVEIARREALQSAAETDAPGVAGS